MIRFILIAFIGSSLLASPLTQGADESPTAILRRQGEEKGRAKDYEAALTLFQKARDLAPDESANYTRIATTAIMLGRRQLGLEALDKACQLDPKLKEVQTVITLRQALEALPAPVGIVTADPVLPARVQPVPVLRAAALVLPFATAAARSMMLLPPGPKLVPPATRFLSPFCPISPCH